MGRTNPTYRDRLTALEREWGSYRRGLRRPAQARFDSLFEHGREYAHAASNRNHPDPMVPLLVSVLLAHERELDELRECVETREAPDGVHD